MLYGLLLSWFFAMAACYRQLVIVFNLKILKKYLLKAPIEGFLKK